MANDISRVIKVDAKDAIKQVGDLGDKFDDGESKGKQLAKALSAMADDIEADLKDSALAADALGEALGPDLAAKVGRNGLDKMVADLKGAGLTADDIRADVDDLAGAIKHLDQVGSSLDGPKQGLQDVGDGAEHAKGKLEGMRGESDQSRSVLANMVGNSAQDVAGLGGVAGTAGMALGQMGEYAADGNIKLGNLAKVAGPMAAVTLVAMGISKSLGEIAATKAFNKKQVDDWSKAIKDGKDSVDDLVAAAADAGKIEFREFGDTKDLVPTLHELGLKADDFFAAVKGGNPAVQEFAQKARDAGASQQQLFDIMFAVTEQAKNHGIALGSAAAQEDVFGDKAEDAAAKAAAATQRYEDQVDKTNTAVQADIDAMQRKWDELHGKIDNEKSMIQFKQQVDDVKQAYLDAAAVAAEKGPGSPEAIRATEDARLKTLDLENTVADYGEKILGLPPEKVTDLIAQIDQGNLDGLPGIVQAALDSRTYRINAHLDNIITDGETHAAGSTNVRVTPTAIRGSRASGGPITQGGLYQLHQDEIVDVPGGSYVNTASDSRAMMRGGSSAPAPVASPAFWTPQQPINVVAQFIMNGKILQEVTVALDRQRGSVS